MYDMKIGLLRVKLRIPSCDSLKSKRSILKRYFNQIRNSYNVAVAEIANHDQPFACSIGIVTIYAPHQNGEQLLQQIVTFLETAPDLQVTDYLIEIM